MVTNKLNTNEVLANVIREAYDLGAIQTPRYLEAAHQRRHRKLVIDTEKGSFLVKTYKRDPEILDTLRFQHRLSDHLYSNALPVARIQAAKSGKRIVEVQNWALELQEFIEGDAMQVTAKSLSISAGALGRFHQVCRDFPHPERDASTWRFNQVPREIFAKLYKRAKAEGGGDEVDECCNRIALFLRAATHELSWEACNEFETGLIHGDWHSGNLIFKGERLVGIIDLEFAGDGCYLEDLAYAISNLCIRTSTEGDRLMQRTDLLVETYQRYRTLSHAEERALYYAVGVKHVATVAYQSLQMDGTVAGLSSSEWMLRLDAQCRWLEGRV